ncbi:MAG: glycine cleavage system protein GcvH [Candidatus Marinimicrobia bacterium]|nr:glycine cleavage system protein GcvH [Candidatus Neomarinimicrobiota bacterium]
MKIPAQLLYSKDHEWVALDGDEATIGITDFAQGELGDIIFVEFPEPGTTFSQGEAFGTIEAVKTVSDLFLPLAGEITALNTSLEDAPEQVNTDPYGKGWIVKMKASNLDEKQQLLDAAAYEAIIA